jgi:hypothetical protein
LDLCLSHRRPGPRRLQVRDGSRLRHHSAARVRAESNVAEGPDAHAQARCGAVVQARVQPELEAGWVRVRERGGRKIAGKRREWKRERQEQEERGMGSTSTRAALFIGGPPNLPVAVPSALQYASTALF